MCMQTLSTSYCGISNSSSEINFTILSHAPLRKSNLFLNETKRLSHSCVSNRSLNDYNVIAVWVNEPCS